MPTTSSIHYEPDEPILTAAPGRFVLHPIVYPSLWNMYKMAQASMWAAEEIDLSKDINDWVHRLTRDERDFISIILAFFAASDGIVNENLVQRFCGEVQVPEARCFYGFQIMMENVHAETYSSLITTLVDDINEQSRLFNAVKTIPCIQAKAAWCLRWVEDTTRPFAHRLVAFAAVEGVLPGLCYSNELISRDEGLHTAFAALLHNHLRVKTPDAVVRRIIGDAVTLEQQFFRDAIPRPLLGMNSALMDAYIECVADNLMRSLGYSVMYKRANPFPFMDNIHLNGRTNFFECQVSEYRSGSIEVNSPTDSMPDLEPMSPGDTQFGVDSSTVDATR